MESKIKKVKVGILAQYLSTRHDVRDLINTLSENCDIILFLRSQDSDLINKLNPRITIEWIAPSNKKYKLFFINSIYKVFGKIPKSKNNYYITERFKISNSTLKNLNRKFEYLLLSVSKITPKFISYDKYLALLSKKQSELHPDIDVFFCITHTYDDKVYANMVNTGKKVYTYVYSWDHPCKMKCFSKHKNVQYLVWSDAIKNDLVELQGIKNENIQIFGATQMIYLHEFEQLLKAKPDIPIKKHDIYIAMATGTVSLVIQEVNLYEQIIKTLLLNNPEISILIRPYPFLKQPNIYEPLKNLSNVTFEKIKKDNYKTSSDFKKTFFDKYNSIRRSRIFMHCGTTMGMEASFLNKTVFFIDLGEELELHNLNQFIHQYQNDKYLNRADYPNVIKSISQLQKSFMDCLNSENNYLDYNSEVQTVAQVQSIHQMVSSLLSLFHKNDKN